MSLKICFVAHFAYGAITGGASGHVGGVEHQVSMMSRWLAAKGYEVSLITWNEGNSAEEVVDGVRLIKLCRRDAGMPGLRFFYPRWHSLQAALARANADVYYQNCAEYVTGQVAMWCRLNDRRFVYSVASDPDCDPSLPLMKTLRDRFFYRYGLMHADRVIVQTHHQQAMLRQGFNRESTVIGMPCNGPSEQAYQAVSRRRQSNSHLRAVWVGRIVDIKRPEMYLEVARASPDIQFELVGGADQNHDFAERISIEAGRLDNVIQRGRISREGMPDVYAAAAVLCCTSVLEGFPNTFLEAWSFGLPLISTVDPDGLIACHGLGQVVDDAEQMVAALETFRSDDRLLRDTSMRCREYYNKYHRLDEVMRHFENLFSSVCTP